MKGQFREAEDRREARNEEIITSTDIALCQDFYRNIRERSKPMIVRQKAIAPRLPCGSQVQ